MPIFLLQLDIRRLSHIKVKDNYSIVKYYILIGWQMLTTSNNNALFKSRVTTLKFSPRGCLLFTVNTGILVYLGTLD